MSLAAGIQISDQDVRTTSTSQGGELLGEIASTSDGRTYAYGLNGTGSGTAIAPGKLMQGALSTANYVNRTGVTYAAGTNSVTFTLGTTAAANLFAQSYFYVNAGTGAGQSLLISGNSAATSGNSNSTTLSLYDSIITATLASDSKFSIQPHPYSAVKLSDHTAPTAIFPTGVPQVSIPDASYGWLQIGGAASVLANGTPAVGSSVIPSATTDGAVDVDGTSSVQPKVGYTLITAVSTEYRAVYLTINNG